jgi:three-Cys-motif partner protein
LSSESVLWPLGDHTLGKHRVLEEYLKAWFPIVASRFPRLLFIDGFAGPGEYTGGELGSPLIALRVFSELTRRPRARVTYLFVEADRLRADHLQTRVSDYLDSVGANYDVRIRPGTFEEVVGGGLSVLEADGRGLPPSFAMIDPFGVDGFPMSLVQRILAHQSSEVYISFMYESMNRFHSHPNFEAALNALFGGSGWQPLFALPDSDERHRAVCSYYADQLRGAGAKYVLRFDLREDRRLRYTIFFATGNLLGCDRMKSAIWSAMPGGDFVWRGVHAHQMSFESLFQDSAPLQAALRESFSDRGWVPFREVNEFVQSDSVPYPSTRLPRDGLRPLEDAGHLDVSVGGRSRRRHTYPDDCELEFS